MAEKEAIMKLIETRRKMNDLGTDEAVTKFEDARETLRMKQWARACAAMRQTMFNMLQLGRE